MSAFNREKTASIEPYSLMRERIPFTFHVTIRIKGILN